MTSRKLYTTLIALVFVAYSAWWIWLYLYAPPDSPFRDYFSDSYGILAGLGGFIGLLISNKWNGIKSFVGKSIVFFSLGLFFQFLGQLSYSLEFYVYGIENSYPSWGEIFFLTSIPSYILGVWFIAKAAGSAISLRKMKNRLGAIVLPLLMMGVSYYFFIYGTSTEDLSFIAVALFFIYPLGQAVYVSFAALAYYLTGNVVGGIMRTRVFFVLFALIFQYAADSTFFYRVMQGTWNPADISEYLFLVSYFLMSIAMIQFLTVFESLKKVTK